MEQQNFDEVLLAFRKRSPFHPFSVSLINGERFEVDHPDAMVVRDGVAIYVAPGGVPRIFDHQSVSQFIGDLYSRASA